MLMGLVNRDLSQASNGTGQRATGEVLLTAVGAMRAAGPTGASARYESVTLRNS